MKTIVKQGRNTMLFFNCPFIRYSREVKKSFFKHPKPALGYLELILVVYGQHVRRHLKAT